MATIASNASHARNPPADSEPFEAWLSDTTRGDMTWVIAGRSRSGKSTLVRNLLRRLDSGTERQVKTLEIPGLDTFADNSKDEEKLALTDKLKNTEADILLYCVSIAPNSRYGSIDNEIVSLLTDIFKRQIWERAIIVFTFADYVNDRHVAAAENPSLECVMEDYAKNFGEILEAQVGSFTVLSSLFHIREGHNGLKPGKIPALPAAETVKSKLLKWDEHLYLQMLTKCSFETVPILVKMEKNLIQKTTTSMSLLIEMCIIGVNILGGVAYLVATSEAKLSSAVVVVAGVVGGVTIFLLERNEHMSSARSISYVRFQEKK